MFLDKNSIMINGVSMGEYLVEAKFGYNKLWANDSGRNLAGVMSGTLLEKKKKITLQFGRLTKNQLETIIPILDAPRQTVSYYDPNEKGYRIMETYTGDYEITNKYIINNNRTNEGFSCSFIATSKR